MHDTHALHFSFTWDFASLSKCTFIVLQCSSVRQPVVHTTRGAEVAHVNECMTHMLWTHHSLEIWPLYQNAPCYPCYKAGQRRGRHGGRQGLAVAQIAQLFSQCVPLHSCSSRVAVSPIAQIAQTVPLHSLMESGLHRLLLFIVICILWPHGHASPVQLHAFCIFTPLLAPICNRRTCF